MGQSPRTNGVSVRTFNRNFKGRSGTANAEVYLASPEVAVAAAITGEFIDPRELGAYPAIKMPARYGVDDAMIITPACDMHKEIIRGPNIRPFPQRGPLENTLALKVLLKLQDNITTDDIMPAGSKILPLRSNIEAISHYVFSGIDPTFPERAKAAGKGCILARSNYGQGSSREHAAIAPMYLGIKAVLAISYARIHRANLINFGILPIVIAENTYASLNDGDTIRIGDILKALSSGGELDMQSMTTDAKLKGTISVSLREAAILKAGGLLNYLRQHAETLS
jgi:aconitate hydratase